MSIDDNKKDICQKLWDDYEPTLRKFCRIRMQSNVDEIDDVIIETFADFLEAMNKDTDITYYKGYIFKICERTIMRFRTESNSWLKHNVSLESTQAKLKYDADLDFSFADDLSEDEFFGVMKDTLSESDILLLNLIVNKKMKYKDIAKLNQTTESAIKQRKYRICRDFKKALNDYKNNK